MATEKKTPSPAPAERPAPSRGPSRERVQKDHSIPERKVFDPFQAPINKDPGGGGSKDDSGKK